MTFPSVQPHKASDSWLWLQSSSHELARCERLSTWAYVSTKLTAYYVLASSCPGRWVLQINYFIILYLGIGGPRTISIYMPYLTLLREWQRSRVPV